MPQVLSIRGLSELAEKLRQLEKKEAKKIVTAGLRVAGKVILGVAKKEAPKLSGNLKKSLGVFKTKHARRGTIKIIVGPRTNFFPKAYYPAFIEWGHRVRPARGLNRVRQLVAGRARAKANPFMQRAFAQAGEQGAAQAAGYIEDKLAKALMKTPELSG